MFQPCPGVASVAIQVAGPDGDIGENILHVSNGTGAAWTAGDLTTLNDAIDTWLTTGDGAGNKYTSFLSNGCTVQAIVSRDLTTQGGPEVTKLVSHAGLDTAAPLQAGLTKAFTLRTGLSGRSNRGRVFALFLTVDTVSSGDVNAMDATHLSDSVSAWQSLIAAVAAAHTGWAWCVLSRQLNLVKRTNGNPVPITSVGYSHVYFDFQRRRAPAHSRHH